MIIMKLGAGLGNQMFQYAFGKALSIKNKDRLLLDISEYGKNTDYKYYRSFGLANFNVQIDIASNNDIDKVKYPFNGAAGRIVKKIKTAFEYRVLRRHHLKFEPFLLDKKGDIYLDGYFQSEKYFKNIRDILIKEFTLKKSFSSSAQKIADLIQKSNDSVSVHVRRGDYVANSNNMKIYGNHCNQKYYEKAVSILSRDKGSLNIFVFSDDIEWVKKNLQLGHNTTYVQNESTPDYEIMMLMSLCQNHIIANSTFGWWPAWLDNKPDKIVIAPSVWIPGIDLPVDDILPPEWIRI